MFGKIFNRIRQKRNDVDHAGYNAHPSDPDKLVRELEELYSDVLNYSNIID